MDDATNIQRLTEILVGTGCKMPRARAVWAMNSSLSDEHIAKLAGWANLEFLMADQSSMTDASIPILSEFPLTDLSIGETAMTADAFLDASWPFLECLGIHGIDF